MPRVVADIMAWITLCFPFMTNGVICDLKISLFASQTQAREPSKGEEHPVKVWQDLQALFSRAAVPAPLPSTPPPRFLEKSISRYHGTSYVTKTSHV